MKLGEAQVGKVAWHYNCPIGPHKATITKVTASHVWVQTKSVDTHKLIEIPVPADELTYVRSDEGK